MDDRSPPSTRARFPRFDRLDTRWMDNDVYGHVNNVVYYSFFDTVINRYLIDAGGLEPRTSDVIGLVVSSSCRYHAPLGFPQPIDAGMRVEKLGTSSVRWEIGLFASDRDVAAADGAFVHVFVDRVSRRPAAIPERIRRALEAVRG